MNSTTTLDPTRARTWDLRFRKPTFRRGPGDGRRQIRAKSGQKCPGSPQGAHDEIGPLAPLTLSLTRTRGLWVAVLRTGSDAHAYAAVSRAEAVLELYRRTGIALGLRVTPTLEVAHG